MKTKDAIITLTLLLALSTVANAGYLDQLRDIDQSIVCVVAWFAPAAAALLFLVGGVLYATGSPENRVMGRTLLLDAVFGLILVVAFIMLSMMLVPKLDIGACY
jgi:hypothetical protein